MSGKDVDVMDSFGEVVRVYKCLCDGTRLRILNLLRRGPLCVCHIQMVLNVSQVNVSKHLAYLKAHGLLERHRKANWNFYRISDKDNRVLNENLKCLQDVASLEVVFRQDLERLKQLDLARVCGSERGDHQ